MKMNNSKQIILLLLMLLIYSCEGTPGHMKFYSFNASEKDVRKDITRIINAEKHTVPLNWHNYEEGKESGDIFVYFKEGPEELYLIQFRYADGEANDESVLALIGVLRGRHWQFSSDLTYAEERLIENRLENEILAKMRFEYHEGLKN